jgi:hypothetical protein
MVDECGAVGEINGRENEVRGENLPQFYFVHHKSRWEAIDNPPELWHFPAMTNEAYLLAMLP